MKDALKLALAVIAGYYLGRHHKLRMAAVLALAMLAGRLRGQGAVGLLQQGVKILGGASPELGKITERVRGDLVDIGKAAAMTATSKQIDSLSSKLHERAEALRHPKAPRPEEPEEVRRAPRPQRPEEPEEVRRPPRPQRPEEPEEGYAEEEEGYTEPYEEEPYEEEPEKYQREPRERPRPRVGRPVPPVTRRR